MITAKPISFASVKRGKVEWSKFDFDCPNAKNIYSSLLTYSFIPWLATIGIQLHNKPIEWIIDCGRATLRPASDWSRIRLNGTRKQINVCKESCEFVVVTSQPFNVQMFFFSQKWYNYNIVYTLFYGYLSLWGTVFAFIVTIRSRILWPVNLRSIRILLVIKSIQIPDASSIICFYEWKIGESRES